MGARLGDLRERLLGRSPYARIAEFSCSLRALSAVRGFDASGVFEVCSALSFSRRDFAFSLLVPPTEKWQIGTTRDGAKVRGWHWNRLCGVPRNRGRRHS